MSSAGELLRSKRLPELSLAASRAVAEANPGPVEESCPRPYASGHASGREEGQSGRRVAGWWD